MDGPFTHKLNSLGTRFVAKCYMDGMIEEIKNISSLSPGIGSITTFVFRLKNLQREAMRNASRCGHLELGMNDKIISGISREGMIRVWSGR